jgi:hypothetical protein
MPVFRAISNYFPETEFFFFNSHAEPIDNGNNIATA